MLRIGDEQIAQAGDARQPVLVDGVDGVDELVALARALAHDLHRLGDAHAGRDGDEVGRHQVAGARLRPLLDLADLLRRLGVELLQRLEELLADGLGQEAEEVGAVVRRHLARDLRDRLGRHLLDELFLLVLVEALEDRRRVLRGEAREELGGLVGLELGDDVGEVLGVELVEEVAQRVRILFEDLLDVGTEEGGEAHRGSSGAA